MKKNLNFIKNKFLPAFLINLAFFAVCQAAFKVNYEVLDDFVFSQLVTDNYYFTTFVNYILLSLIGFVQKLIYPLNAYVIVTLLLGFSAMTTISYIFFDKFKAYTACLFTVLFNGAFAIYHYASVSFSNVAALLTVSGLFMLVHSVYRKHWVFGTCWGALLAVLGGMYRFKIFCICIFIFVIFIAVRTFIYNTEGKQAGKAFGDSLKELLEPKRLCCGIVLVAVFFGLLGLTTYINKSTDELAYYSEYTDVRSDVWDYDIPSYEEQKEEYDKIGIDENDLILLEGQYLDDEGAFSLEKLRQIKEIKDNYYQKNKLKNGLSLMLHKELRELIHPHLRAILYFTVFVFTLLFLALSKKRYYWIVPILLMINAGFYLALYIIGRAPLRSVYELWFAYIVCLLYSLDQSQIELSAKKLLKARIHNKRFLALLMCAAVAFSFALTTAGYIRRDLPNDFQWNKESRKAVSDYVQSHPDDKFELSRLANLYDGNIYNDTIYTTTNQGRYMNSHIFNGTYYRMPYYNQLVKDIYGTDNMFSNLLNENVYYIDTYSQYTEALRIYLEKYYSDGKSVSAKVVAELGDYQVVSYTTDE